MLVEGGFTMTVDQELFADTLPTYLTRFIGREQELQDLVILARFPLVTICGVGGIGKTRLRSSWRRYFARTALLIRDTPTPSGYRL